MIPQLIAVPYDCGRRGWRMGAGPLHWLEGLDAGITRDARFIDLPRDDLGEIAAAFTLARAIADAVRRARAEGRLPLVLGGNCNTSWGTYSALADLDPGVIWFDAHGDLNTPDTTTSGFLDGMALAALAGRGWTELMTAIDGFRAVKEERIVLAGARDLDPAEIELLENSTIQRCASAEELEALLPALAARATQAYVHIDLDVIDAAHGRANHFATGGGWSGEALIDAIAMIRAHLPIGAIGITAYDPAIDSDRRIERIGMAVIESSR